MLSLMLGVGSATVVAALRMLACADGRLGLVLIAAVARRDIEIDGDKVKFVARGEG